VKGYHPSPNAASSSLVQQRDRISNAAEENWRLGITSVVTRQSNCSPDRYVLADPGANCSLPVVERKGCGPLIRGFTLALPLAIKYPCHGCFGISREHSFRGLWRPAGRMMQEEEDDMAWYCSGSCPSCFESVVGLGLDASRTNITHVFFILKKDPERLL